MRKRLIKLTLLGVMIANFAYATEFRSPWVSERGPLRYRFEKSDPDRYSLDIWSVAHRRESHKAFLKHGTDTKPLTALFFNKANFKLNEIFPDSVVDPDSKYYNPFMHLMTIYPRATYYEWGANLGARFEYPVWEDKGRIGLRAVIPFRTIEIERENIVDKTEDPIEYYRYIEPTKVANNAADPVNAGAYIYSNAVDISAKAYNLGFVTKLFINDDRVPAVVFADASVGIFGQEIATDFDTGVETFRANIKHNVGLIFNEANKNRPVGPNFGV